MADKKFVVKNGLQSDGRVLVNKTTDNNTDNLQIDGTIHVTDQIKSTLASGTAPFTVSSGTVVTNLNSDKLDGQDGSYYLDAANFTGTLPNDFVTLGTMTTGNYVATISDAGSSRITVANSGTESAAVTLDIANDAVTLGTHTTGNYVSGVSGTTNEIEVTHTPGEGSTATIGLPNDVTIANDLTIGGTGKIIGPSTFYIDPAGDDSTNGTVIIQGSLTVTGTTTTVDSNNVSIGDSILVLNSDETGTPSQNGGLELERGTANNAFLIWDETADSWQVNDVSSSGGATYYSLLTSNDTLISVTDGSTTTNLTSGGTATFAATSGHLNVAESSGTITYSLPNSGVTAASYGSATAIPVIDVDAQGRITSATTASISTSFDITDGSNTQTVSGGDTLTVNGTTHEVEVAVSAADTLTIGLPDDVTIGSDLTVTNDFIQGQHVHRSATLTTTSTTQTPLVTNFSATTYASAEVNVVAVQGSTRHLTKLLVTHDGTTAYATEFGEILTGSSLATYDVDINSGNVRILVTPASTTSTKFQTSLVLAKN